MNVNVKEHKMLKVNLGCGNKKIHGWTNVDIQPEVNPDMILNLNDPLPWKDEVDLLLSVHNLEHYDRKRIPEILTNWFNALKPGGILRLSVPDFEAICKHYIYHHNLPKLYGLLHGGLKNAYDVHYISFDFDTLKTMLESVGFKDIKRYDRWSTDHSSVDDYSAATLNPEFSREGLLMSLNVQATK